jgi:hypothetical protein
MEDKNKSMSQKILNDLEKEYQSLISQHSRTLILNGKISSFSSILEDKAKKNCEKEINELNNYGKVEMNENNQIDYKKFPGKEKEANQALEKFTLCQSKFENFLSGINHEINFSLGIISNSTNYCIEECQTKNSDEEGLKTCYKNCFDYTFKYFIRSSQEFLIEEVDMAIKELNKI